MQTGRKDGVFQKFELCTLRLRAYPMGAPN